MASNDARGKSVSGVKHYGAGVGNTASYLVSGTPFIASGSLPAPNSSVPADREVILSFPNVTKHLHIENVSPLGAGLLNVHFAASGSTNPHLFPNHRYITVAPTGEYKFDMKCSELYLSVPAGNAADAVEYLVIAELTGIAAGFQPSGSGVTK